MNRRQMILEALDTATRAAQTAESLRQRLEYLLGLETLEVPKELTSKVELPQGRPTHDEVRAVEAVVTAAKKSIRDRMLDALATYGPLTRAQLYFYTGLSMTSGPMGALYADLREEDIIYNRTDDTVQLTGSFWVEKHRIERRRPYDLFEAAAKREGGNAEKLLRAHYLMGRPATVARAKLCHDASVSLTSGPTGAALGRLKKIGIAETSRGQVTFSDWYLRAIEPTVAVFSTTDGKTRHHDAKNGKPLP